MIPSVKEGFEQRNTVFRNVINKYRNIIDSFNVFSQNKYSDMLMDYENYYSDQYYKLKRWASQDVC